MTDKQLRKLSRAELLEMLIEQGKEVENLRQLLESAQKQLEEREIAIQKSGSIAEASLKLNDVFKSADEAAEQYLENVRLRCREIERETREKCDLMLKNTHSKQQASG